MKKILILGSSFCIVLALLFAISHKETTPPPPFKIPESPRITNSFPGYQDYSTIENQLKEWASQASGFAEVGTYGISAKGKKLYYIRLTNLENANPKKKVLITACIHGNEPLASSVTMGYVGSLLAGHKDPNISELLNTRDIYFVPVVSPDSYPGSRYVDGVDPNRDFPGPSKPGHKSSTSVLAIQKFFQEKQFNAAISGHTYGRVYLIPYGDKTQVCPNNADYERIIGQMQKLSGYKRMRACQNYGHPIYGTEVDWYYRIKNPTNDTKIFQGCFSIVCEYGTHQRIPSMQEVKAEFDMTFRAFLHFCKESPLVEIPWDEKGNPIKGPSKVIRFSERTLLDFPFRIMGRR